MRNIPTTNFQSISLPFPQWKYFFFYSVIHSKHLLNPNYTPDTLLGPEDAEESNTDKIITLMDLQSIVE